MESLSALRSFHYPVTSVSSHARSLLEKTGVVPAQRNWSAVTKSGVQGLTVGRKLSLSLKKRDAAALVSAVVAAEPVVTANSSAVSSSNELEEKSTIKSAIFPNGFQALLLEVCNETEVAELKLKIGEFEMHVKRSVGAAKIPNSVISPSTPPPIPSEPMDMSVDSAPPPEAPPKHSPEMITPFTNVRFQNSSRLAALEASGASGYVLVSCPLVGSFQRGRTVKGVKKPPTYKEGDLIKEGQTIGWVDQFQTELPIKSDVSGEVLKVLVEDGEAVGYGDPLLAVLPSFHGIRL